MPAIFRTLLLFFTLFFLCPLSFSQSQRGSMVVVIDAGHGGKDPGAVSGGFNEKDINLSVALKVGQHIKDNLPQARIIYTRSTDVYIELSKRSSIANNARADIFISIHCNANKKSDPNGTETFVMGVDKAGANLSVAMQENSVIEMEDNYQQQYGGYDPNSAESFIIFSLMQYTYQERSLTLANEIQKHFTTNTSLKNRGVKQAGFLVLWRATMPSVLCEIGFLSNPTDRAYISSSTGQRNIARSIATAATNFLQKNNSKVNIVNPNPQTQTTPEPQPEEKITPEQKNNTSASKVHYRVQIKTASKQIEINSTNFGTWVTGIRESKLGNLYKYSLGNEKSYKDALTLQRKLKQYFSDCFVVAYDDQVQITLEKAKQKLGQ